MAAHLLRERWTHPQAATKEDAQTTSEAAPSTPFHQLLDQVAKGLDGKSTGEAKTIRFDLGDEGIYRLIIEADGACRAETGDGEATATLHMKASDAVKLLTGKLNPMIAFTTGKIKAEGDVRALMALQGIGQ
jgi:putative sterol carrier protein